MMKIVMNQLIKFGEVKRGVLGVNIQTLTPDIAQSMDLDDNVQGALVSQVVEGSAAEKAGIKAGDIITAINGRPVKDAGALRNSIGLLAIGEKVDVAVLRDGKPRRVTAVVSERDTVSARATGGGRAPRARGRRNRRRPGRRADPQRRRRRARPRSVACAPTT